MKLSSALTSGASISLVALLGPLLVDLLLELALLLGEDEPLEGLVGVEQRRRAGMLVVLADLQPEHAVFHHVGAADAVAAGEFVEVFDECDRLVLLASTATG